MSLEILLRADLALRALLWLAAVGAPRRSAELAPELSTSAPTCPESYDRRPGVCWAHPWMIGKVIVTG